jgi:hypothetical protein
MYREGSQLFLQRFEDRQMLNSSQQLSARDEPSSSTGKEQIQRLFITLALIFTQADYIQGRYVAPKVLFLSKAHRWRPLADK